MRRRPVVLLAALALGALPMRLPAAAAPADATAKRAFSVTNRQHTADTVTPEPGVKRVLFRIRSTKGIGFCTITPTQKPWPESVVLLLEPLTELESLTIQTGQRVATGSRKQSGSFALSKAGSGGRTPEGTLNVTVERRKDGIVVRFPAKFFQGKMPVTIHWVDWFRR